MPSSLGGPDTPENLVVACRRCNTARKTLSLALWATYAATNYSLNFTAAGVRKQARKVLPC